MKKYIMEAKALPSGQYYDHEYDQYFNVFRETNAKVTIAFMLKEDSGEKWFVSISDLVKNFTYADGRPINDNDTPEGKFNIATKVSIYRWKYLKKNLVRHKRLYPYWNIYGW